MKNKPPLKYHILIIDDEMDLLTLLTMVLEKEGYEVSICFNGEDYLDCVISKKPDLILQDIRMNGITGDQICRELKSNPATKQIPVILFSANHDLPSITEKCGADAWLLKPLDLIDARKKFNDLLG